MTTACVPRTVELCRGCRLHVSWPVTGVAGTEVIQASLDGGPWVNLAIAPDLRTIIGYFAGPDFATPGVAAVVPRTAHVTIRIVTTTEELRFDGGFIRVS